jgi:hypothetical protein
MKIKSIALGLAAILVSGGIALAAQQGAAAKKLLVRNPTSGNRKILYKAKNTTASIVGNPMSSGASFNIALGGDGSQCMSMPASGWYVPYGGGYRYKDQALANGPIKVALIRQNSSGKFNLLVIAKGAGVSVTPADPTTGYNTNFKINGGGDEYCASNGMAIPTQNDALIYKVKDDDGTACATACSSPSGAFVDASTAF